MLKEYDILIIGAGPAGCAAAIKLACAGYRVAVFEKGKRGREKVCGDALIPDSIKALKKLGVWSQIEPELYQARAIRAYSHDGGYVDIQGEVYTCKRHCFDHNLQSLAQAYGADLFYDCPVSDLIKEGEGVTIRLEDADFYAKAVIVAIGAEPKSYREVMRDQPMPPSAFAIRRYVRFDTPHGIEHLKIWYSDVVASGYAWAFPVCDHEINLGVGMFCDEKGKLKKNIKAGFNEFCASNQELTELLKSKHTLTPLKGAPICTGLKNPQLYKDRMLFCGEMIGSTYAMTGEGIGKAMETGIIAADTMIEALIKNDFSKAVLHTYAEELEKQLRHKFMHYDYGQRFVTSSFLLNKIVKSASQDKKIREMLEDILHERRSPAEIFSFSGFFKRVLLRI